MRSTRTRKYPRGDLARPRLHASATTMFPLPRGGRTTIRGCLFGDGISETWHCHVSVMERPVNSFEDLGVFWMLRLPGDRDHFRPEPRLPPPQRAADCRVIWSLTGSFRMWLCTAISISDSQRNPRHCEIRSRSFHSDYGEHFGVIEEHRLVHNPGRRDAARRV